MGEILEVFRACIQNERWCGQIRCSAGAKDCSNNHVCAKWMYGSHGAGKDKLLGRWAKKVCGEGLGNRGQMKRWGSRGAARNRMWGNSTRKENRSGKSPWRAFSGLMAAEIPLDNKKKKQSIAISSKRISSQERSSHTNQRHQGQYCLHENMAPFSLFTAAIPLLFIRPHRQQLGCLHFYRADRKIWWRKA